MLRKLGAVFSAVIVVGAFYAFIWQFLFMFVKAIPPAVWALALSFSSECPLYAHRNRIHNSFTCDASLSDTLNTIHPLWVRALVICAFHAIIKLLYSHPLFIPQSSAAVFPIELCVRCIIFFHLTHHRLESFCLFSIYTSHPSISDNIFQVTQVVSSCLPFESHTPNLPLQLSS